MAAFAVLAWFGWAAQNTTAPGAPSWSGEVPEGVPARTFRAYLSAAAQAPAGCEMTWPVLAGFGAVESGHGTFGGATVAEDGTISPPIIGPALDGINFAYYPDSDGGKWDGDTTYDRAVGFTQFTPPMWRQVMGEDADPQNVDNGAVATMRKVCHDARGPVTDPASFTRAAWAYNPDAGYVREVARRVEHYQRWQATHPEAGAVSAAVSVDEPTLVDVLRTMGQSGQRQWATAGELVGRDGDDGILDGVYRALDPAVSTVLGQLAADNAKAPSSDPGASNAPSRQAQRIVDVALSWVGRDYRPGTREQCAWFVRQVLHESDVRIGVTARPLDGELPTGHGMANSFGPEAGEVVRGKAQLRPGDIVMFLGTYGPASWANSITHVGVYVGDGMMVDRSTASAPVQLRSVDTFRFGGAVRLADQGARP